MAITFYNLMSIKVGYNIYIYTHTHSNQTHLSPLFLLSFQVFVWKPDSVRDLVCRPGRLELTGIFLSQPSPCWNYGPGTPGPVHCCLIDGGHNNAAGFCVPHLALQFLHLSVRNH